MGNPNRGFCIGTPGPVYCSTYDDFLTVGLCTETDMPHVLLVHESESIRAELKHALLAEELKVTEADSSGAAVREIWGGSFDVAVVSGGLPGVGGSSLEEHLRSLAPEIVTVRYGKEPAARLAKKVTELLEGGSVAA